MHSIINLGNQEMFWKVKKSKKLVYKMKWRFKLNRKNYNVYKKQQAHTKKIRIGDKPNKNN